MKQKLEIVFKYGDQIEINMSHILFVQFTKPIADEIVFSSIYKQLNPILKKSWDANLKISHPINKQGLMHSGATRLEINVTNTKGSPNRLLI